MSVRIGQGYDVHAFGDGDHVVLGGVRVAHERGVLAHSDGDVVLHALCDAMLGALALGDIGRHFPPSDPQIGPHAEAMRARIAGDLGIGVDAVSVKATTSERLGFTGREEGIAAQAVVLLVRADTLA